MNLGVKSNKGSVYHSQLSVICDLSPPIFMLDLLVPSKRLSLRSPLSLVGNIIFIPEDFR